MNAVGSALSPTGVRAELGKVAAFLRRDVLIKLSYRLSLLADWIAIFGQILIFSYVSKLVDASRLPSYGGERASYIAFVAVGIAVGVFMQVGVSRVVAALRSEQLIGTLESIMVTPTSPGTMLVGSVAYDLVYVPIRTVIFLVVVSVALDADFALGGLAPSLVVLAAFIPFVWGLGALAWASVLTFRRGTGVVGLTSFLLTIASGAYFPIDLFPGWAQSLAQANPLAAALDAMRESLIGGAGWAPVWDALAVLVPATAVTLAIGTVAFRLAIRRERRLGTLGMY